MEFFSKPRSPRRSSGFSLIELLTAMAVLALLLVIVSRALVTTQGTFTRSAKRVEAFKETRAAFETMTRRLSQATLNSYWGYNNPANPTSWMRQSELHFVTLPADPSLSSPDPSAGHAIFFQAPFGYAGTEASAGADDRFDYLDGLLNGWGYYIEFNSDLPDRSSFLSGETATFPERRRFRLMELRIPSEKLTVMKPPAGSPDGLPEISSQTSQGGVHQWFTDSTVREAYARPIAENVVALIISPRIPDDNSLEGDPIIAPAYSYDSRLHQYQSGDSRAKILRHQLPPVIDITLVATEERSWSLFEAIQGATAGADLQAEVNARFLTVADYETDLEDLMQWMQDRKLEPRIFRISISIRGAKFSTEVDA